MILVAGAAGNIGSELVAALAEARQPVRALTRSAEPGRFPPGAEAVAGDLNRVAILGQVLGRDLRFEAQTDEEARAEMSATTPARYVDAFFDFYAAGTLDESRVLPTVREVTGRPPRTFAQWAAAHAGAFR